MNEEQLIETKIAEEAIEIAAEVSAISLKFAKSALKSQQFGLKEVNVLDPDGPDNLQRLNDEFNDLIGVMELFGEIMGCGCHIDRDKVEAKKEKVRKFQRYSEKLGRVK